MGGILTTALEEKARAIWADASGRRVSRTASGRRRTWESLKAGESVMGCASTGEERKVRVMRPASFRDYIRVEEESSDWEPLLDVHETDYEGALVTCCALIHAGPGARRRSHNDVSSLRHPRPILSLLTEDST